MATILNDLWRKIAEAFQELSDGADTGAPVANTLARLLKLIHQSTEVLHEEQRKLEILGSEFDSLNFAVMTVNAKKEQIVFHTPRAAKWLMTYFPKVQAHSRTLPNRLAKWLKSKQVSSGRDSFGTKRIKPLIVSKDQSFLTVRVESVQKSGECLLLLSEENETVPSNIATFFGLTPREGEILYWLEQGLSCKEAANKLEIAHSTALVHLQHIREKLNIHSKNEAIQKLREIRRKGIP